MDGVVALFNYSNIISCALCSLSNYIFILLHAIKTTVFIPLLETVSEQQVHNALVHYLSVYLQIQ